jgi:hypothetical protein
MLFAALKLWPSWPHATEVEFSLGAHHADVVELHVTYVQNGHDLHGVSFNFPEGAPSLVRHTPTLPAGTFQLRCALRRRSGAARQVTRELRAPATGRVRIRLDERDSSSASLMRSPGPRAVA